MFNKNFTFRLPHVIATIFSIIIFAFLFFTIINSSKPAFAIDGPIYNIAIGLTSGLIVALAQFLLSWFEFSTVDRIRSLRIKNVISTRDNEGYYRNLIEKSNSEIIVFGVTASRFLSDFSDPESKNPDKKVLISALNRGVNIKILVSSKKQLKSNSQIRKYETTIELKSKISHFKNFEFRYFDHEANTNIFLCDDDIIIGPIFSDVESKDTPSIHMNKGGALSEAYLEHFNKEWQKASEDDN